MTNNFISIYDNALDKKYCDHLIEKFELHKEHQKKYKVILTLLLKLI